MQRNNTCTNIFSVFFMDASLFAFFNASLIWWWWPSAFDLNLLCDSLTFCSITFRFVLCRYRQKHEIKRERPRDRERDGGKMGNLPNHFGGETVQFFLLALVIYTFTSVRSYYLYIFIPIRSLLSHVVEELRSWKVATMAILSFWNVVHFEETFHVFNTVLRTCQ